MSEAKFTNGEWVVYIESDDYGRQSYDEIVIGMANYNEDPYGHYCMHKITIEAESTSEEAMANAHLIAAAPKMYKMLCNISKGDGARVIQSLDKRDIKSLLAKARGEKPVND